MWQWLNVWQRNSGLTVSPVECWSCAVCEPNRSSCFIMESDGSSTQPWVTPCTILHTVKYLTRLYLYCQIPYWWFSTVNIVKCLIDDAQHCQMPYWSCSTLSKTFLMVLNIVKSLTDHAQHCQMPSTRASALYRNTNRHWQRFHSSLHFHDQAVITFIGYSQWQGRYNESSAIVLHRSIDY